MLTKWTERNSILDRWDPFAELAGLRRLFDQPLEGLATVADRPWRPAVDVLERKDGFVIDVELPGVKAEDVHISVEGDRMTLKGERKLEQRVEEGGYTRLERRHGSFERVVLLPPTVDAERVKATYENGILQVHLPKKEEAKPKRIPVHTV